jgi:hypothetical protein
MKKKDDNKLHIKIPSFIGFTEDGTLLAWSSDPAVKAEPEKWKKLDRRFKGKKRIYRKMNVDGKMS